MIKNTEFFIETSQGVYKSKNINGIDCPVKVSGNRNDRSLPEPQKTSDGHLIYALPGGFSFSNGVVWED
jgi:hypothetical protein